MLLCYLGAGNGECVLCVQSCVVALSDVGQLKPTGGICHGEMCVKVFSLTQSHIRHAGVCVKVCAIAHGGVIYK
jgi:hypothetical protein